MVLSEFKFAEMALEIKAKQLLKRLMPLKRYFFLPKNNRKNAERIRHQPSKSTTCTNENSPIIKELGLKILPNHFLLENISLGMGIYRLGHPDKRETLQLS